MLPRSEWQRLRRRALYQVGEPCGLHVPGGGNLICHEQWTYDNATRARTLIGVDPLPRL
ncbi:hypothetical protein [Micromonospora sp. WMMD1274]|uniref:hypothetical protein n=1 Tax=Micromonospora sp. WMMD1274 TaxID=3404116 RepID=UPI0016485C88